MKLKLNILENLYTIHRFPPNHKIPKQIYESGFYSIDTDYILVKSKKLPIAKKALLESGHIFDC